jgi:hypothetical protein
VRQLPTDDEPENIRKALKAIGESKLPLNEALINDKGGQGANSGL